MSVFAFFRLCQKDMFIFTESEWAYVPPFLYHNIEQITRYHSAGVLR
jgi:hypothetical protein